MQTLGDKELITAISRAQPGEYYFIGTECWKLKETGQWARFKPTTNKYKPLFPEKNTSELIDSIMDQVNELPDLGFLK